MNIYVCVFVSIYPCIHVSVCICTQACVCAYQCVCGEVGIYVYVYVSMHMGEIYTYVCGGVVNAEGFVCGISIQAAQTYPAIFRRGAGEA